MIHTHIMKHQILVHDSKFKLLQEREFLEKKKDKDPFTTETGDPILDEEEFEALILLKQVHDIN